MTILPNNTSCLVSSRKRKRELHVSFCTQPENIVYTWSQSDYDRSGLFPDIKKQDQQFIFTLSINFVQKPQEMEQPLIKKKSKFNNSQQRPKLSIDTSNLSGPLYFTGMTTNHQKKERDEEESAFDFVTQENTRRNSLPLIEC
ncbi:uncharacterized protein EV154DRAFT_509154 [Mucor mucedo]|uniref:Uncharacterized protein n=1 Tax=Mucor saturninus TaxID=64648 RepID=A0A8H7RQA4_9FUNG|nr:uncharacterized protein EV154DRAFT_509154 [Mucor mucedo]KAG2213886.1 hypothetical protein INT47_001155 [Mucor saturninus]KAI7891252.1 hypothetical protein EV154DRAFT_509154 [Mucor mucedo]